MHPQLLTLALLAAPAPAASTAAPPPPEDPVVVSGAPVAPPVECARLAVRLFGGDRKEAVRLCGGGTGGPERIKCAELAMRTLSARYADVASVCTDGGNAATGQCVQDALRWLGDPERVVILCAHGGEPKTVQCARDSRSTLNNDIDEAIDLCRRVRGPALPR
jgi:hypothetical protein